MEGHILFVELARTIHIRWICSIVGRESTKYTVIYSVYIRFQPTLSICPSWCVLEGMCCALISNLACARLKEATSLGCAAINIKCVCVYMCVCVCV